MQKRLIAIETDYGTADGRAAKLVGAVKRVDASLEVCFANHACPRGNILFAGTMLYNSLAFFPRDTVYACIVERADGENPPCAAKTHDGKLILAPDNGSLTIWLENFGIAALRRLDAAQAPADMNPYAWFAARLANGTLAFDGLGPEYPVESAQRFPMRGAEVGEGYAECGVLSVMENFGNLNLSVSIERFEQTGIRFGDTVRVTLCCGEEIRFDADVRYDRSFGFTAPGAPILFNGSSGYVGLGLNQASFSDQYMKDRRELPDGVGAYALVIRKAAAGKEAS